MTEKKETELGNSILALLGGAAAVVAVLLILYPLEMFVFDEFFELDFSNNKSYTTKDWILFSSILIWFSLSAIAGGLVCSLICRTLERRHTWILAGLSTIFFLFAFFDARYLDEIITILLTMGSVIFFFLYGCKLGLKIKQSRNKKDPNL